MERNEEDEILMDIEDGSEDSIQEIPQGSQSSCHKDKAKKVQPSTKKRRLSSRVWSHFSMLPRNSDGKLECKCNKCGAKYAADSKSGTEEWERVKKICGFLEVFHNATVDFSGSRYPTSNLYFPHVFVIQLKLHEESSSQDLYMKKIADQMFVKFNKYWCEFNVLFAIAVIFDPRYKFQFVEFSYGKLYGYGSRELMKVRETLFGIFGEYMKDSNTSPASSSHSQGSKEVNALTFQDDISKESSNVLKEFDESEDFEFAVSAQKSQLEMYLDEPRSKRTSSINVLEFWRSQQFRYPELAKLARDVLAVPVSTVASESAFSLGGRILDQYRSSMSPQVVEALICSRDWLFGENCKFFRVIIFLI
ncbi:hypothetical protein ZIOFF_044669 [Zingiber officinale]|uniref:Uncharacterized protein n=1 Tax=Zingiber officinale TaxID=94328 RepID=A0A8J5KXI0_ZINOF|nr:hypothetical protein ZIOFF_044669 [Zingiber officinale]